MKRKLLAILALLAAMPAYAAFNAKSLNAVTATGVGSWFTLQEETASGMSWTVVVTGSPSATSTTLEGCIEDDAADCTSTKTFTLDTSTTTSSEMRHVVNKDVKHLRCNLGTLTGGSSPTVTCRIFKGKKP